MYVHIHRTYYLYKVVHVCALKLLQSMWERQRPHQTRGPLEYYARPKKLTAPALTTLVLRRGTRRVIQHKLGTQAQVIPLQPARQPVQRQSNSSALLGRRLLQRFIKSAAGERASDLRVSLSGGSLVLANLELNLDALLGRLPLRVERAYARQLRVTVPWTALATQAIQARPGGRPCCSQMPPSTPQAMSSWRGGRVCCSLPHGALPCMCAWISCTWARPPASLPARAFVQELGCDFMAVKLPNVTCIPCTAVVADSCCAFVLKRCIACIPCQTPGRPCRWSWTP